MRGSGIRSGTPTIRPHHGSSSRSRLVTCRTTLLVSLVVCLGILAYVLLPSKVSSLGDSSSTSHPSAEPFVDPRGLLTEGEQEKHHRSDAADTTSSVGTKRTTAAGTRPTTRRTTTTAPTTSSSTTKPKPPPPTAPIDTSISLIMTPASEVEDGSATCMCFAAHSAAHLGANAEIVGNTYQLYQVAGALLDRHNRQKRPIEPRPEPHEKASTLHEPRLPRSIYPIVNAALRQMVLQTVRTIGQDAKSSNNGDAMTASKLAPRFVSYRVPSDSFHAPIADSGNYDLDRGQTRFGDYLRGVFDTCVIWVLKDGPTEENIPHEEAHFDVNSLNNVNPTLLKELGMPYYTQRDYRGEIVPNCFEREVSLGRVVGKYWGAVRQVYGTFEGLSADAVASGSGALGASKLTESGSFKPSFNLPYIFLEELLVDARVGNDPNLPSGDSLHKLTVPTLRTPTREGFSSTNKAGAPCHCTTFGVVLRDNSGGRTTTKHDVMLRDQQLAIEAEADKRVNADGPQPPPAPLPRGVMLTPPLGSHVKVAHQAHEQIEGATQLRAAVRRTFVDAIARCLPGTNPSSVPLNQIAEVMECLQGAQAGFQGAVGDGVEHPHAHNPTKNGKADNTFLEHVSIRVIDNDGGIQNNTGSPHNFSVATLPGHTPAGWSAASTAAKKEASSFMFVIPMPYGVVADGYTASQQSIQHVVPLHSASRDILASVPRVGTVLNTIPPAAAKTTTSRNQVAGMVDYDDTVLRRCLPQLQHSFAHLCETCGESDASSIFHADMHGWATSSVFAAVGEEGTLFNLTSYYLMGGSNVSMNIKDEPTLRLLMGDAYLAYLPLPTTLSTKASIVASNDGAAGGDEEESVSIATARLSAEKIRGSPAVEKYTQSMGASSNEIASSAFRYAGELLDAMTTIVDRAYTATLPSTPSHQEDGGASSSSSTASPPATTSSIPPTPTRYTSVQRRSPRSLDATQLKLLNKWKTGIQWVTHVFLLTPFGEGAFHRYLLGRIRREYEEARLKTSVGATPFAPHENHHTATTSDVDDVPTPAIWESVPLPILLRIFLLDQYHKGILEVPTMVETSAMEGNLPNNKPSTTSATASIAESLLGGDNSGTVSRSQEEAMRYIADDDHALKLTHIKMAARIFHKFIKPVTISNSIRDAPHKLFLTAAGLKQMYELGAATTSRSKTAVADLEATKRLADYLKDRYLSEYFADVEIARKSTTPAGEDATLSPPPPPTSKPILATSKDSLSDIFSNCQPSQYETLLHVSTKLALQFYTQKRLSHLRDGGLRYVLPLTVVSLRSQLWELLQLQDAKAAGRLSKDPHATSPEGPLGSLMPFRPQPSLRPTREELLIKEAKHNESPNVTVVDREGRVHFMATSDSMYHASMRTDEAAMQYCLLDRTQRPSRINPISTSASSLPPKVLRKARLFFTRSGVPIVCQDGNDVVCNQGLLFSGLWDEHLVGLMQHGLAKLRDEVRLAATILKEREEPKGKLTNYNTYDKLPRPSPTTSNATTVATLLAAEVEELLKITKGGLEPMSSWWVGSNTTTTSLGGDISEDIVHMHWRHLQASQASFLKSKSAAIAILMKLAKRVELEITGTNDGGFNASAAVEMPTLIPHETVTPPRWSYRGTDHIAIYKVTGGRFGQHASFATFNSNPKGTSTNSSAIVAASEWLLGAVSANTLPLPKVEGVSGLGPRLPVVPSSLLGPTIDTLQHVADTKESELASTLQKWIVSTLLSSIGALNYEEDALESGVPQYSPLPMDGSAAASKAVRIPLLASPVLVSQLSTHLVAALHQLENIRHRRFVLNFVRLHVQPGVAMGKKNAKYYEGVINDSGIGGEDNTLSSSSRSSSVGVLFPEMLRRAIDPEFISERPVDSMLQLESKASALALVAAKYKSLLAKVLPIVAPVNFQTEPELQSDGSLPSSVPSPQSHDDALLEALSTASSSPIHQSTLSTQTYDSDVALLDVGANIGVFSYYLRQQAHVDTYQFEALPSNAFLEASSSCMSTIRVHALWQSVLTGMVAAVGGFDFEVDAAAASDVLVPTISFASVVAGSLTSQTPLDRRMKILSQGDFRAEVLFPSHTSVTPAKKEALLSVIRTVSHCHNEMSPTVLCVPAFERESKIFNIALGNESFEEKEGEKKRMCVLMGDEAGPADTILTCDPAEVHQAQILWDELLAKGASPSLPATFRLFDDRPKVMIRGRLLPQEFVSLARLDAIVYSGGTKYPGTIVASTNSNDHPVFVAGINPNQPLSINSNPFKLPTAPFTHMTVSAAQIGDGVVSMDSLVSMAMKALYTNPDGSTSIPTSVLNMAMIHRFKGLIVSLSTGGGDDRGGGDSATTATPIPSMTYPFHVSRFHSTRDLLRFVCVRHYVSKIDVEGFEPMVLAGAHKLLDNPVLRPPVIVSEVWNSEASKEVCKRMVRHPKDGGYGYIGMTVEPTMALFSILSEEDVNKVVSKKYLGTDLNTILWVQRGFEHHFPTILDGSKPSEARMPNR